VRPDERNPLKARGDDGGLWRYASFRTRPGGILLRDFDQDTREELSDAVNYLTWAIEQEHDAYLAGDPAAADNYERRMRALTHVVNAWHALHTPSA
jgi:hypothetical protein